MVNEINKPPSSDHLNERLAASNSQLQDMQEEHRRLLQEMEALRERANALNRLTEQRQQLQLQQQQQQSDLQETKQNENQTTETVSNEAESLRSTTSNEKQPSRSIVANEGQSSSSIASSEVESSRSTISSHSPIKFKTETKTGNANDGIETGKNDDNNSADYIQQKISEIAALKAQYQRVQHMLNTTKLIENHLSSKSTLDENKNEQQTQQNEGITTTVTSSSSTSAGSGSSETPKDTNTTPQDPKEELLEAMLNMFTDFSDDLRGQAENLRAERERIRNLKDILLQRHKNDS